MDGTAASKPAPIIDGLLDAMKDAVASVEAYGEDAKAAMAARLAPGGKIDRKLLDVHQHSAHGLSWVITYVETLREVAARERTLAPWHDALALYASVQRDVAAEAAALLDDGLPDLRLPRLPDLYADLVGRLAPDLGDVGAAALAAVPLLRDLCAELAATGLPDTLQHDDLHDAQVFVRDARVRLLDWGDACLSHPFLTLAVTLDGVLAWGLDDEEASEDTAPYLESYLAGWAGAGSHEQLVAASRVARRLGWACRAVNGHVPQDPDSLRTTRTRLRMFLDGRAG